jgi:hypothetical protein
VFCHKMVSRLLSSSVSFTNPICVVMVFMLIIFDE